MKSLRPITVVTVGPVVAGLAWALLVALCLPEWRTPSRIVLAVLSGVALGLIVFAPIATGLAIRGPRHKSLLRHSSQISWYTSLAMGLSLGYLFAWLLKVIF